MKKIITLLFVTLFALTSCQQEDEIFETKVKNDLDKNKVDICHKGRTININVDSIEDHLNHGDKLGKCSDDPNVNYTFVPDNNFEQALIDRGYDDVLDNLVLTSNISSNTALGINGENISDLTGIEDFISLTRLSCGQNQLVELDLSKNILLEYLYCRGNQLVNLDLSENSLLTSLNCSVNNLESLILNNGNNLNITRLQTYRNTSLTCIQVDDEVAAVYLPTITSLILDPWTSFSEDCGY